jgi:hypothetical protein
METEKGRIGQFFLFIGLILLVIFFFTDQAQNPSYGYFFFGAASTFLGGYLMWRYRKPGPQADRFRSLRRAQMKSAERKAEKKAKKAANKANKK